MVYKVLRLQKYNIFCIYANKSEENEGFWQKIWEI